MSGERVLVTGGSGFLAAHCIAQLLERGYRVRTTVRSAAREPDVRAMVAAGRALNGTRTAAPEAHAKDAPARNAPAPNARGPVPDTASDAPASDAPAPTSPTPDPLTFTLADLSADDGWSEAVEGCAYVLHVASPFPPGAPKDEDEVITPAREGALRVLRAARDAGVRRVVLTSSFAAIGYGHPPTERPFTEEDWTDTASPGVGAYVKSKALAERAAWDFAEREGGAMELAVVNPVGIFGPVLGPDYASSIGLVKRLLEGAMQGVPRMYFAVVDVRDVADLHLRAMSDPAAAGRRFLAAAGDAVGLRDIAALLRHRLGPAGARVPTRKLPDWSVKFAARRNPEAAAMVPNLGVIRHVRSDRARRLLGWQPRSWEETVLATAESLTALPS
ncbi:SDR family oxidoreductase [Actinacidiphila guanduensis]|uniref:Dihydroflavonol-4-reductase n=1 Tax=Actinacidiphila guanduensis TaxID=310781 RepID=A0A1H0R830_9ACTN|nr:aldehyde reductase [Actinacidiphila guanduensis]SDP25654.1 dihydroflavonol-4-reductase [Actinacidiphila guanduensis]